MCTELQDFDLRVRGAVQVAKQWEAKGQSISPVWPPADVVAIYNDLLTRSFALFDAYCRTGELPGNVAFSSFVEMLEALLKSARSLLQLAAGSSFDRALTQSAVELQGHVDRAQAIIDEDRFATDMALLNLAEEK